ncbi:MAG: DUF2779 domain-containing protein [Bacteroidetes bacterium]|nr:DUF2779 domain-containing protein [Bacteroidota bacterium]
MSHYLLSKSSYIKGLQCPKALFFYRHYPQFRDPVSPSRQATFNRGHEVGFLARQLFPGGKDATEKAGPKSKKSVERTAELIAAGENIIYEAAFVGDQVLVLVDILVRDGDGWRAYEVKSSLRLSHSYFRDAELQFYVLKKSGLNVKDFSLVHLNGDYVRNGELDLKKLFRFVSVMQSAEENSESIEKKIAAQKNILKMKQAPEISIGDHCFYPYECDFRGQCWKNIPAGNVFELTGISRSDAQKYFSQGFIFPEQIPDSEPLPVLARLQAHVRMTKETLIVKERIREWLSHLTSEIIFLDIENFQPAIPKYEGTWPFLALPFAFSIHKRNAAGEISFHSFMAEPGPDPREEFLEKFLSETEGDSIILSYDSSAEKNALNLLKRKFTSKTKEIEQRLNRILDLKQPFAEGWYYHPAMSGSVSLKNVLPALVPELHYENIAIQNGIHAMSIYEKLDSMNDLFALAEAKTNLQEYIELDTLGMVRILEVLENSIIQ